MDLLSWALYAIYALIALGIVGAVIWAILQEFR